LHFEKTTKIRISYQLGHLEAGLRSFDRSMPEEINQLVTDSLADILWTPSPDAGENLEREGISREKIQRVGNMRIDSLEMLWGKIESHTVYRDFGLEPGKYGLVTLHRPSNVDHKEALKLISQTLVRIVEKIPLIFPVHPRTRKNLDRNGLMSSLEKANGLSLIHPLSYIRFMNLVFNCRFAVTDSGGIQEETTYFGIACLTMRPNTERPITITLGTNQLCKADDLEEKVEKILNGNQVQKSKIELWDGQTAGRVVQSIRTFSDCQKLRVRDQ